jgi:transcriptional regulator with XRE-family HTH domain
MRTVVDPRFGTELRRLRGRAGLSLAALATQVATVKGHISDMEHGRRSPSKVMAGNLDAALGAGGALSALVQEVTSLDRDELDRLDYTMAHPHRADTAVVSSLRLVLMGQRHLDDSMGAAAVLPAARETLKTVESLVMSTTGPIRDNVLDLASQYSQFLGWLHTTSENWPAAKAAFAQALEWGTERGDVDMIATVLSYQGHCHWLRGEYAPVVSLSRAAKRDRTVYAGQLAYDGFQEARGLAVTGQVEAAKGALDEADWLAAANEQWIDPIPAWQYYRAEWFFDLERGLVYRCLARHDRSYADRAVEELSRGVAGIPPQWQGSEWGAEYMAYLASALRAAGDIPEAKATAERTRQIATATSSARVLAMVDKVEAGL